MGTADAVPGISGGTIALITGIYERLIAAITALDPSLVMRLPEITDANHRGELVGDLLDMDVPFLLVLGLGIVTALVSVSRVAHVALHEVRAETFAFFFGLIAASAIVLYSEVDASTPGRVAAGIVGFLVAFVVSGLSGGEILPNSPTTVFLAGVVTITAMILPGISGASLLLLLGQYEFLTGTLTRFVDALVGLIDGGTLDAVVAPGAIVATFVGGAFVGVVTIAHLIERALATYRAATLTFLVSLLVGTLRVPVIEIRTSVRQWSPATAATLTGAALVGIAAVLALDRYTDDLEY